MNKKNLLPTEELFFLPVSGCEEIGMNLNVYGYKDELIIADYGVKFDKSLGREVIVPDYRFLEQHIKKIKACLLPMLMKTILAQSQPSGKKYNVLYIVLNLPLWYCVINLKNLTLIAVKLFM